MLGDMLSFGGWTGAPKTRGALASSPDAIKNFWTLEFLSSQAWQTSFTDLFWQRL